jgi:hypothetical protein
MIAVEVVVFAGAAGFALIAAATVLVVLGVRAEERQAQALCDRPRGAVTLLARRILGVHASPPTARQGQPEAGEDPPGQDRLPR